MKPITVGLAKFSNELFQDYGPLTASVVLTIIPTLLIFISSRRFIVRSITISGLKA
jgi:ABC-type glycerol-3-phosphate transport system permease component